MNGVGDMVFSGKKNLGNVSVCKIKSATHCQTQGPSWELELTDVQTWPLSLTTAQERVAQHGQQAKESLPALDVEPLKTKKAKDHPTTLPQVLLQPLSREIWCPY